MRKLLLSLTAVALLAGACGSAASIARRVPPEGASSASARPSPADVPASPAPARPHADPARRGDLPGSRHQPVGRPGRATRTSTFAPRRRHRLVHDRPALRPRRDPPDPASIRVEEWVNAFDQGYPAPAEDTFAIVADGGPTPFTAEDEVLLRIGLQARAGRAPRPPAGITHVRHRHVRLDGAGRPTRDGQGRDPDPRAWSRRRRSRRDRQLRRRRPRSSSGRPRPTARRRSSTRSTGSIRAARRTSRRGLRLGYELARQTLTENGIDRIVLASDGVANVGLTDPDGILGAIKRDAAAGIELVSVGVGMGNYNDALLEQLADQGDGFYAYVNTLDEARRLFGDDLTSTLETVALDARAQVVFDRESVVAYRLVGYENRAIDDEQFTNDNVAAGAIGAGHASTALYAVRLRPEAGRQGRIATVSLRWTDPNTRRTDALERDVRVNDLARSFGEEDPHLRFDALVATAAEVLRGGEAADGVRLSDVARVARDEADRLPQTDEVHDFLLLLDDLSHLRD